MKDLNISEKSYRKTGSKISDILCSTIFADVSPKAREIKGKK